MQLMLRLGVDLSSSESSEGSIGPGYENVVVLPWLLVKLFGKDLPIVSSPISSGSCSASLSSSLSHTYIQIEQTLRGPDTITAYDKNNLPIYIISKKILNNVFARLRNRL